MFGTLLNQMIQMKRKDIKMKYSINAIETEYNNYKFRSRLEARWASFFDLLGWKWEYEPIDFNGWIPDFVLYGSESVYVEVKPVVKFPEEVVKKIESSGCENEALIVGETFPLPMDGYCDQPFIGWLMELSKDMSGEISRCWSEAVMGKWKDGNGVFGFGHRYCSFYDRISGGYDGGCWGELWEEVDIERLKRMWAQASNKTRWEKTK